jgi:hypothetical protein
MAALVNANVLEDPFPELLDALKSQAIQFLLQHPEEEVICRS